MQKVRFTALITKEENEQLKAVTYERKHGENRSACFREMLAEAYQQLIQSQKKASGKWAGAYLRMTGAFALIVGKRKQGAK